MAELTRWAVEEMLAMAEAPARRMLTQHEIVLRKDQALLARTCLDLIDERDRLNTMLRVERGEHVEGVTDGWECMIGYDDDYPSPQWFRVGASRLGEHIEAGTADGLPWVRLSPVGWWLSMTADRSKVGDPYPTAYEAIVAAKERMKEVVDGDLHPGST